MTRLFAVGFRNFHPDSQVEAYSHAAKVSLDDADVVLFALPSAPSSYSQHSKKFITYKNIPRISDEKSNGYRRLIGRWRSELKSVLDAGKTVFVPLTSPEVVYVSVDEPRSSAVFRSRSPAVARKSNLDVLPCNLEHVVPGFGSEIRTTPRSRLLDPYWQRFAPLSRYEFHFALTDWLVPLLTTRNSDHIVSALVEYEGDGNLVLIPAIDLKKSCGSAFRQDCIDIAHRLLKVMNNCMPDLLRLHPIGLK